MAHTAFDSFDSQISCEEFYGDDFDWEDRLTTQFDAAGQTDEAAARMQAAIDARMQPVIDAQLFGAPRQTRKVERVNGIQI